MAAEKGDGHVTTPLLRTPAARSRPGTAGRALQRQGRSQRRKKRPPQADRGSRPIATPNRSSLQPPGRHRRPSPASRCARTSNGRSARAPSFKLGASTAPGLARKSMGGRRGARARLRALEARRGGAGVGAGRAGQGRAVLHR